MDVSTRFCVLRPLMTKSAADVAWALWTVVCDYGVPKIIQSARGTEFVNSVIIALTRQMGIDHRLIASYHPQANGLAENMVKLVSQCVYKSVGGNNTNWDFFLPGTQLWLNSRIQPLVKAQPHALMFARPTNPLEDYKQVEAKLLTP